MPKKYSLSGFTLIEVIIAMTLLSIMVVLLFGSLKISAESWNKGETKIAEVNEKAVVYQFFKRHLPTIRPLWDEFSDGEQKFSFQGGPQKLQFVSTFPASAGRKGFQLFKIVFDDNAGQIKVLLSPFYPSLEGLQWQQEEVILLEHVTDFKITYFGKEFGSSNGVWFDSWVEKEQLPRLIKIKIKLTKPGFWPEMIFELKLATNEPDLSIGGL